jgi:uncharacterized membrane protein|uniref:Tic20 family protein Ycf60 n=1 Tax=Palmaria decipiens TaxID=187399 RepID=A0A6C0W1E7_PALDE|nr:Ycf60 [Palmaria decipiens]QIC19441.1 Ycf60 [Palmaria decipiens]
MLTSFPLLITAMIITLIIGLFIVFVYRVYILKYQSEKASTSQATDITILDRFSSTLPYWLPLLEGLQNFGQLILPHYPLRIMRLYKKTLLPFVSFYIKHPALAFITFFALYYLFVRSKSPLPYRPFIRFNVLQSILLFLINSLLGAIFRALPIEFRTSFFGLMVCNTLFWFAVSTIIYPVIKSIEGKYAKIPIISQAVRIQINNQN